MKLLFGRNLLGILLSPILRTPTRATRSALPKAARERLCKSQTKRGTVRPLEPSAGGRSTALIWSRFGIGSVPRRNRISLADARGRAGELAAMDRPADEHRRLILEQFTRQAVPFAERQALTGDDANRLLIALAGVGSEDEVLDVACGPGIVACALAAVARHVTGIDLTPAMIDQAKAKQRALRLDNLSWVVGDAVPLPFADRAFSVVGSRYSFHHLLDPRAVFAEMVRVTRPGGRVAVIDVYTSSPQQSEAYNRVERWRDPSHVRALSVSELTGLFREAGLCELRTAFYGVPVT